MRKTGLRFGANIDCMLYSCSVLCYATDKSSTIKKYLFVRMMMALLLLATTSNCGFVSIRSASTGECLDTSLGGPTHLLVDLYACVSDGHNERFTIDAANSVIRLGPGDQGPENGSCLLAMPDGSLSQAKCNSSLVRHQPPTTSHSSACQQTDLWSHCRSRTSASPSTRPPRPSRRGSCAWQRDQRATTRGCACSPASVARPRSSSTLPPTRTRPPHRCRRRHHRTSQQRTSWIPPPAGANALMATEG